MCALQKIVSHKDKETVSRLLPTGWLGGNGHGMAWVGSIPRWVAQVGTAIRNGLGEGAHKAWKRRLGSNPSDEPARGSRLDGVLLPKVAVLHRTDEPTRCEGVVMIAF